MLKAYAYIRVSGKGQIKGDGYERQKKAILDYATANGIEIVNTFYDKGESGTTEDRPALANMLVDLDENGHGIKSVLIEKLDRLARDLMVQEAIIRDFKTHGFNLISTCEGEGLLEEDPTRTLIRQVFGALAQYEKSMLVAKLRAARNRKRYKTGRCEGQKTYGDISPKVLERIKELRRKPKGKPRMRWMDVAQQLNSEGLLTKSGKPWTSANSQAAFSRFNKRGY